MKISEVIKFVDDAIVEFPESEAILKTIKYRIELCKEEESYPCEGSYQISDCVPDHCMNGVCPNKLFYLQARTETAKHIYEVSGECF